MKILVNNDVIVYEENNEIILVNMIKNNFYALDYIGSVIWRKIEETKDLTKLIDIISKEFNEEKNVIKNDLIAFVFDLEKAGVVKLNEKI